MAQLPVYGERQTLDTGARFLRPFRAADQVGRAVQRFGRTVQSEELAKFELETQVLQHEEADRKRLERQAKADESFGIEMDLRRLREEVEEKRSEIGEAKGDDPSGTTEELGNFAAQRAQARMKALGVQPGTKQAAQYEKYMLDLITGTRKAEDRGRAQFKTKFYRGELENLTAAAGLDPNSAGEHIKEWARLGRETSGLKGQALERFIANGTREIVRSQIRAKITQDPALAAKFSAKVVETFQRTPTSPNETLRAITKQVKVHTGINMRGLSGSTLTRLNAMFAAMPKEHRDALSIVSGHRSVAKQARLHAKYLAGGPLAAPPGRSRHNFGTAIDVGPTSGQRSDYQRPDFKAALAWMHDNSEKFGLVNPLEIRGRDPIHFQEMRGAPPVKQPEYTGDTDKAREVLKSATNLDVSTLNSEDVAELYAGVVKSMKKNAKAIQVQVAGAGVVNGDIAVRHGDKQAKKVVNSYMASQRVDLGTGILTGDNTAIGTAREVIRNSKFVPDAMAQQLQTAIQQKGEGRLTALEFLAGVTREDPAALKQSKLDAGTKTMVEQYVALTGGDDDPDSAVGGFMTPDQAVRTIDLARDKATKINVDNLRAEINDDLKKLKFSALADKFDDTILLAAPAPVNDTRGQVAVTTYRQHYTNARIQGHDHESADKIAIHQMKRVYGVSTVAASDQSQTLMAYPPEKFYPPDADGEKEYITTQAKAHVTTGLTIEGTDKRLIPDDPEIRIIPTGQTREDVTQGRSPRYMVAYRRKDGLIGVIEQPFQPDIPDQEEIRQARRQEFSQQRQGFATTPDGGVDLEPTGRATDD